MTDHAAVLRPRRRPASTRQGWGVGGSRAVRAAGALGAVDGDPITVSTDRGSLTLPLVVADLPDGVVWVPTRTAGAAVRTDLAAQHGDAVSVTKEAS